MTDYLRTFLRFDPPAIRRAVLLNFAAALTEGAGLLMLLPLLSLAGVLEQGGGARSNGWEKMNRMDARDATGKGYEELSIAV